jgi:hypothetical protein
MVTRPLQTEWPPNRAEDGSSADQASVARKHQWGIKTGLPRRFPLTVRTNVSCWPGTETRGICIPERCAMHEEFSSYGFLAVALTGPVLICSGLLALALT